ncbi:MAG TPA: hypothetical protein VIK01_25550, partial [Polyangiaceae bacterium]
MRLLPLTAIVSVLLCFGSQVLAEGQPGEHLVARREALLLGAKRGPGVALAAAPRDAVTMLGKRASVLIRPPVLT